MITGLEKRLFSAEELEQMVKAGILDEGGRVELIEGEIITMRPIGKGHAACVDRLTRFFNKAADESAIVRVQGPVLLTEYVELQPDLAVLAARPDYYQNSLPTPADIRLVVEVADTTVKSDRLVKLPIYAKAGVPVVWIVNLPRRTLEVYTEPQAGSYRKSQHVTHKQTLTFYVPGIAATSLRVEDIL